MKFKVGELVKSNHTGFIYKVIELRPDSLFLRRTNCDNMSNTWTPSYYRAQIVLSRVESTEYPSLPEIMPDPKTQHCKLCILCQANPARFCDCNKPKPDNLKTTELPSIVLRQGWDNILYKNKLAYLHMDSDTVIYAYSHKATSWYWNSKFDTNGKQQSKSANTALALMKQVEDYLQQSNYVGHNKSERR